MRALGVDYGDARIGLALSDPLGWTAGGLRTLTRKNPIDVKACIDCIEGIVLEHAVSVIVLGLPRNMDGSEGDNCRKVRTFADKLTTRMPHMQIEFYDERLSTVRATQIFNETGAKKRDVDKMAAQLILQGYLDAASNKLT